MQAQLEPWQGLDPRQVRDVIDRQKKQTETSGLKPWHPKHPEAAQTDARIGRVKNFIAASRAISRDLPPEQQSAMKNAMAAELGVSGEDAQLYQEHEQYVQGALNEFTRDPATYIEQHTQNAIQRALQEYDQFQSTKIQTQQFMTDPKNATVIKEHADTILWAMNNPQRRDVGIELARVMAERDSLKLQVGKQTESVATAEAQSQALRGKAGVSRDPRTSPVAAADPVKSGLALGLKGDALIKHIEKTRAQAANAQE
ncbi:MAG: hypothetical protein H0U59_06060 [Gemmatimonadaceae bacterium]|nr:hypothetical protein [Gemmatimonadaceae bacterium]